MEQPCILLVEPDILVRQPLAEYLRDCGYRVLEATDEVEARTLIETGPAKVDVVLADATEPGIFALARWIREAHPAVRVILAGTVARATEWAGDLCEEGPPLKKPYDHRIVHERIRRLIAARERNGAKSAADPVPPQPRVRSVS